MKSYVIVILATLLVSTYAGSITRNKRGYLSRTGYCPNPADNYETRDIRLNYFGIAVIRKSDNPIANCKEKECDEDSHCDGNRKCCANHCGAKVCSISLRDPHPCSNFDCPADQTCKVHKVKCVMPDCPDAESVDRPTCIPKTQLLTNHAERLGDNQPDTSLELIKAATAAKAAQSQSEPSYDQQQQESQQQQASQYARYQYNDAMQQAPQQDGAASYNNDQQAYGAPMDPSAMAQVPGEVPNILQAPMDSQAAYGAPNQDTANILNYQSPQGNPQMDQAAQPQMDQAAQPQMDQASQPQMDQDTQPQMDQAAQPQMDQAAQPQMDQAMADQPPLDPPQVVAQPPAQQ